MQHLFFDPTISSFQGISQNGRIVSTNDRRLISNDTINPSIFLGVKKCIEFPDKVQQIQKDIFLIKHKNAFELSEKLYAGITGVPATWNYHSNTVNMDWALFLVSSLISIDQIDTKEASENLFSNKNHPNKHLIEVQNIAILKNLNLIIGVQNGYDSDEEITFYATIKHRHYEKGSYLTIGSYKFPHPVKTDYLKNNKDINILIKDIENNAAIELKREIEDFKKLYTQLYDNKWATISTDFLAVCLDILNYNRSIESIKNDKDLKGDINLTREYCQNFLNLAINKGRGEFVMLLDYIIFSNHFDLMAFQHNRKKTEQIFVQKRSYKTIKQRIVNVIQTTSKINDYLNEQNDTYKKILPYL